MLCEKHIKTKETKKTTSNTLLRKVQKIVEIVECVAVQSKISVSLRRQTRKGKRQWSNNEKIIIDIANIILYV